LTWVSAAAKAAGHEVLLLDLMTENDCWSALGETISSFHPEIIGISVRNIDDQNMDRPKFLLDQVKSIVVQCRNLSGRPFILGGAGYSIFPEAALRYLGADMGIQGEGEWSFPLLIDRMERGDDISGIPGLYVRDSGMRIKRVFSRDLDRFPLPAADHTSLPAAAKENLWIPLQTRRGCPMDCSYYSTAAIEGRAIRRRRLDSIIAEISTHTEAGFQNFYFVDNVFNLPGNTPRKSVEKSSPRACAYPGGASFIPGMWMKNLSASWQKRAATR